MTPQDKAQSLLDRLRALAQEASGHGDGCDPRYRAECQQMIDAFTAAANPATVLALVEVLDRLLCPDGSCGCEGDHQTLAAAYDALEPEGGA